MLAEIGVPLRMLQDRFDVGRRKTRFCASSATVGMSWRNCIVYPITSIRIALRGVPRNWARWHGGIFPEGAMVDHDVTTGGPRVALIALGANLPGPLGGAEMMVAAAVARMAEVLEVMAVSGFYCTPAFGPVPGPDYVNAALSARWTGTARDLMALLHAEEAHLGRDRAGAVRWAARLVDLDLLALGDLVLPDGPTHDDLRMRDRMDRLIPGSDDPILPHPGLHERAFVLRPLADIAPGWCHPRLGQTVTEMLAALPQADRDAIFPLPRQRLP
jgi:2-amino-4-hydroxy-6-hydroxymethyldihydropteridine diphosphokinase